MRRFDAGGLVPLGRAVRVAARSVSVEPVMSSDGRLFVSSDRATHAIDAETLSLVRRYPVGSFSTVISPDGGTLAVEDADGGDLRLLDLVSGGMRTLATPGSSDVADAASLFGQQVASGDAVGGFSPDQFSPDGRTLATTGVDRSVVLWDVSGGFPIETLAGHASGDSRQFFSPDGRTLYTVAEGEDSTVIIWDLAGDRRLGSPFRTGLRTIPNDAYPPAIALSPDGGTLAVARLDGKVDLIDAETLRHRATFEAFADTPAPAIAFAPDGRRLAVGGARGLLGICDAQSGRRIGPLLDARVMDRAPIPVRRSRSRAAMSARFRERSLSVPEICSPPRASGGSCGSGISIRGSRSTRRSASRPSRSGSLSVPMGRSSRSLSATTTRGPMASRSSTELAASGSPGCPPRTKSVRSPSPRTAGCWRAARSTVRRSSGRPTAGSRLGTR